MARKSRWQQFADNFNATYNTFNNAFSDFEEAKVLKKEFTGDDGQALTGQDLDRARYQALADIRTKYGDAEGGLNLRAQAANLEAVGMANEINRATMDDQIWLQGAGARGLTQARINQANASAARARRASAGRAPSAAVLRARADDAFNADLSAVLSGADSSSQPGFSTDSGIPLGAGGLSTGEIISSSGSASSGGSGGSGTIVTDDGLVLTDIEPVRGTYDAAEEQDAAATGGLSFGSAVEAGRNIPRVSQAEMIPKPKSKKELAGELGFDEKELRKANIPDDPYGQEMIKKIVNVFNKHGRAEEAKEFLENYTEQEQLLILNQSVRMAGRAQEAFMREGVQGVAKVWDEFNGNTMTARVHQDENGVIRLVEFDPENPEAGVRVVAQGGDEMEFRTNLQMMLSSPAEALELSAAYHDSVKKGADAWLAQQEGLEGRTPGERAMSAIRRDPTSPFAGPLLMKHFPEAFPDEETVSAFLTPLVVEATAANRTPRGAQPPARPGMTSGEPLNPGRGLLPPERVAAPAPPPVNPSQAELNAYVASQQPPRPGEVQAARDRIAEIDSAVAGLRNARRPNTAAIQELEAERAALAEKIRAASGGGLAPRQ